MEDKAFPITRDIICLHCGHKGVMDIHNENDVAAADGRLFMHLGHNPSSGDLHYQCPACGIVLLVDPMLALGKRAIEGMPQLWANKKIVDRERVLQGLISKLFSGRFLNESNERRFS